MTTSECLACRPHTCSTHRTPKFNPGDHVQIAENGESSYWVFEFEGYAADLVGQVRLRGVPGLFRENELRAVPDLPLSKALFKIGDRVKVSATKADFGSYDDAWEIANGRTFVVKSVFTPPFNKGPAYGCKFVARTLEEGWLSPSSDEPWTPAEGQRTGSWLSREEHEILVKAAVAKALAERAK